MAYDFKNLKAKVTETGDWLRKEFSAIRTGRATPMILDTVLVESYGAKMKVANLASVNIEDARSLRITPYDASQIKNIEKAIVQSNLGLSVSVDDRGVRIVFPELTADRREAYIKVAKEKIEEARKHLRNARDEVWKDIQAQERDGKIREDDKFRLKDSMQKTIDDASKEFDTLLAKKEQEIRS
ncbi:MAG: ribosome recycling factor [Candidatus Taylorbacteria bacterium RIFCSPHIGHO2_01_FULL_46_22b]|uniref:Ribosome recycling factor n=1 Tax=Candidatus Taylorbacteria bacterium RIFCSPHIGHO2_01_FULL_46_22b TaxID=1802301 RepID=A0A1G2M681_9BACT|nr:MAG: ribosome recycling factor [Candidatus Taylorbacteria bacterium RIFCSPHIGHO2_01_FULL_46_22b]